MPTEWENKLQALLDQVANIDDCRQALDGLSPRQWQQLRTLNADIIAHIGAGPPVAERRISLRLPAHALVQIADLPAGPELWCHDFGQGGLLAKTKIRMTPGTIVHLLSISILGENLDLGVAATVARISQSSDQTSWDAGLEFSALKPGQRERVSRVFNRLLEMATQNPDVGQVQDWGFAVRDDAQLSTVCHLLMRLAGLDELWSDPGPTFVGQEHLRTNGQHLRPGRRAMLLTVWSLWRGDFDLHGMPLVDLDSALQKHLVDFFLAARIAAGAVDAWIIDAERILTDGPD